MPASANRVSLDQAKDWAKRLLKAQQVDTLASGQKMVSIMLGHGSWHDLEQFYKSQPAPGRGQSPVIVHLDTLGYFEPGTAPDVPRATEPVSFDESMARLVRYINFRYPGIEATEIHEMAREVDFFSSSKHEVADKAVEAEREGYFLEDSILKALDDAIVNVKIPDSHILVRVLQANGNSSLVVMTGEEYGVATGLDVERPKTDGRKKPKV